MSTFTTFHVEGEDRTKATSGILLSYPGTWNVRMDPVFKTTSRILGIHFQDPFLFGIFMRHFPFKSPGMKSASTRIHLFVPKRQRPLEHRACVPSALGPNSKLEIIPNSHANDTPYVRTNGTSVQKRVFT